MPLVLLALLGFGAYYLAQKNKAAHGMGLTPAAFTVRTDGTLVATKEGATLVAQRLFRYGPAEVQVATGPVHSASATKRFLGAIGKPGSPPILITETAMDWVRDAALSGQAILLETSLFARDTTPAGLPTTIHMLARDLATDVPLATQLAPYMTKDRGWVLLGSPTELASKSSKWPDSVADFVTLG